MAGMLQFTSVGQDYPEKRAAGERAGDFGEISRSFEVAKAEEQSSRCSQCGVPYCSTHCPLHNHIPDWLRLTPKAGCAKPMSCRTRPRPCPKSAAASARRTGCARAIASSNFRATARSRSARSRKFITDTAWERAGSSRSSRRPDKGQSIAVIGAGPAGLTVADLMRARGYDVHVYDRHDRMGGLLTYGIPGFKLEKYVVERRVHRLRDGGVVFHANFEVGRDATSRNCASVTMRSWSCTGVYKPRAIKAPGVGAAGVVESLDYLTASNRKGFGDRPGVRRWHARRARQECRGRRRRRYRDGLRPHRDPPGRGIGEVPLSPRSGQHARLAARGEECRGGGRRVRLALRA
jgi:glutamate synthase (NADPH/NADH) small chain